MQWFAQAAAFVSSLFASSNNLQNLNNGGGLQNAPANAAGSISTSSNVISQLRVVRNPALTTTAGVFGNLTFDGRWICATLENPAKLIQPGIYTAQLDKSPHLGYVCPHLRVPQRDSDAGGDAGLRIHVANYISQIQGCVAVGLRPRPDYMEQSQAAFDKLMAVLPQTFTVEIC